MVATVHAQARPLTRNTHLLRCVDKMAELMQTDAIHWCDGSLLEYDQRFLWPGFSENMRVLKWIVDRVRGRAQAKETPIGWTPCYEDMDWTGLKLSRPQFDRLLAVDRDGWRCEVMDHEELFLRLHDHLPPEMIYERELLICRL